MEEVLRHMLFVTAALLLATSCVKRVIVAPEPESGLDEPDQAKPSPPPAPKFTPTAFGVAVTGSGRPMILIPGMSCSSNVWNEVIAHAGFEYHALTLAGFGGRPPVDRPLFASVIEDLTAYIRDRKLEHPIVVGHSLGGMLAMQLALDAPEVVGPVVVVDGRAVVGGDPESVAYAKQMKAHITSMSPREYAASTRFMFHEMSDESPRLDAVIAEAIKSDPRTVGDALIELFSVDLRPRMASFRAPLLMLVPDDPQLIWAARSQIQPAPNHKLVVIPNARHFLMIDNPTAYNSAVDAFAAAHP
jgi:pimeloyl-ACP methyl ester carboxylesterase